MHDDLREQARKEQQMFVHAWEWVFGYTPEIETLDADSVTRTKYLVEGFWWRYGVSDQPYLEFVANRGFLDPDRIQRPRDLEHVLECYERNLNV